MADSRINLILGVRDNVSPALKGMRGQLARFQSDVKRGFFMGAGIGTTMLVAEGIRAVGDALGGAITAATEFDDAMTKSLAIMGDVSDEMREKMERAAIAVARTTTYSAKEAADAYYFLASAGLDAVQSVEAMPRVAQFAQAGNFDLARATDLLTDAQSALGLTVDDTAQNIENMTQVSDVLVKANTLANASVEQFSTSLTSKAGAALKAFGIDLEEGVAVLAAFADQGVKAEEAGNALDRILRLLPDLALRNAKAFREMGIEVFDSSGELNNLGTIVDQMTAALSGLSDAGVQAALSHLGFQARVQGIIKPLIGAGDKVHEYEAGLREAGGTTKDVADKQLKSLGSRLDILGDKLETVGIQLADNLVDPLTGLAEGASGAIDFIEELLDPMSGNVVVDFSNRINELTDIAEEYGLTVDDLVANIDHLGLSYRTVEEFMERVKGLSDDVNLSTAQQIQELGRLNNAWEANTEVLRRSAMSDVAKQLERARATLRGFNDDLDDYSDTRGIKSLRKEIREQRGDMEKAARSGNAAKWARAKAALEELRGERDKTKQAKAALKVWKTQNRARKQGEREFRESLGKTKTKAETTSEKAKSALDKYYESIKKAREEAEALAAVDPDITITGDSTDAVLAIDAVYSRADALLDKISSLSRAMPSTVGGGGSGGGGATHTKMHGGGYVAPHETVIIRQNEAYLSAGGGGGQVVPLDGQRGGAIHTHVYLNGREIATAVDEQLGRRASTQGRYSNYRSAPV